MWHGLMCYKAPAGGRGHEAMSVYPNISKYYPEEGWGMGQSFQWPTTYSLHFTFEFMQRVLQSMSG